ncbi:hypothetical protein MOTT27_01828 [Mycobacterium intracellulare subsp. yongonense]|nr:hypothetical protein MOTT27_01828 [Mycobacterium intracellulare subsp. yongonense]
MANPAPIPRAAALSAPAMVTPPTSCFNFMVLHLSTRDFFN